MQISSKYKFIILYFTAWIILKNNTGRKEDVSYSWKEDVGYSWKEDVGYSWKEDVSYSWKEP